MTKQSEQAKQYADRGWYVLPLHTNKNGKCSCGKKCGSPAKHPRIQNGLTDATRDTQQIHRWWKRWPDANIGVRTGSKSGLLVIDIDTKDDGEAGLAELQRRWGKLPETVTVRTGGGGRQLYFKYPDGHEIRPKVKIGKGVDLRAQDSYVVAPSSLHISGKEYEWASDPAAGTELAEFPATWRDRLKQDEGRVAAAKSLPSIAAGKKLRLSAQACEFIAQGVDDGDRNNRCFMAAVEMAGGGYTIEEARDKLAQGAVQCSPELTAKELESRLESAFSKQRYPYVHDDDDPDEYGNAEQSEAKAPKQVAAGPPPTEAVISNIIVARGREDEVKMYSKPISSIASSVREATSGWPKDVGGRLFVKGNYDKSRVPTARAIRFIENHTELFAWLHENTGVHWPTMIRKGAYSHKSGNAATPVSRPEFFEHLKAAGYETYHSAELLPHYPEVQGAYYVDFDLPLATGERLNEFVNRLNAETDLDRALMKAALVTPLWGGPCGARPAFVFCSEFGRGVGKTSTVEHFCKIFGGRISLSPEGEDWKEAKARLLADDSLSSRCVLIDNIRKRLRGSDLEALITAPVIDGKKMYVGQYSRPNRMTFYMTSNTPMLSQDLADRSVILRVGQKQHDSTWGQWVEKFVDEHREQLLSDILAFLQQPDRCTIERKNLDRWANWQQAVLAKFENGNELTELVKQRRGEVSYDLDDAVEVAEAIEQELVYRTHDLAVENVTISRADMYSLLKDAGLISDEMGKKGTTTWLKNLADGSGPLARLVDDRSKKKVRAWLYVGDAGRFDEQGEPRTPTVLRAKVYGANNT